MKRIYLSYFFIILFTFILVYILYIFLLNNYLIILPESFININRTFDNSTIILIGDSVLNNSNYVSSEEYTTYSNLKKYINKNNNVTIYNYSQDGATINDCYTQLDKTPNFINNKLYIILSCGGNDILNNNGNIDIQNILIPKLKTLIESIKVKFPLAQIYLLDIYYPFNTKYTVYNNIIKEWNNQLDNLNINIFKIIKIIKISKIINTNSDLVYDIEPSNIGSKKIAISIANNL